MNKSVSTLTWQRALWTCVVLVILNSLPIGAQFDTAVVLGTVRDGSGAVVPAASITLKNTETGITAFTPYRRERQLPVPQRPHRRATR